MSDENNQSAAQSQTTEQQPQVGFAIQKLYLKDISFETPSGVEAFTKAWQPNVQQDLNIQVNTIEDGLFEVLLLLTITASIDEKVIFLIEVKQGGLFSITGIDGIQLSHAINTLCPQILFPYARELIDSTLVRGGFPPLMLAPINFDAIFSQAVMQAQQQAQTEPTAGEAASALN
jgi:preprotein translocase subunit SecB